MCLTNKAYVLQCTYIYSHMGSIMQVSATELRTHVYQLLDRVVSTGEILEVKRRGQIVKIMRDTPKSRLSALIAHPDTLKCTDDELIYNNGLSEWNDDLS